MVWVRIRGRKNVLFTQSQNLFTLAGRENFIEDEDGLTVRKHARAMLLFRPSLPNEK
jgi:hypothetical protein